MSEGEVSRLERAIELLRADAVAVREGVAALMAQFDMWKTSDDRTQRAISDLQKAVREHAENDASTHAGLTADVRRLWWGVGVILTALAGTIIASLAAGAS